jgi:monoamine oxidase
MEETDIIIIGGGACGLLAASELCRQGDAVTILEARDRLGGRIHTLHDGGFSTPVEMGAEFIHGDMPVTLNLLHKAGVEHYEVTGQIWESKEGKLQRSENFIEDWDLLEERLQTLTDDMTISEFLKQNFPGEKQEELRKSVTRFVEGYDAADTTLASTFSLRDEWLSDENASQYRVKGGYGRMIDFLEKQVKDTGGRILLETLVSRIDWEKGRVTITTADGKIFVGGKALITVPLSILQKRINEPGFIAFYPDIPGKLDAAGKMGFGGVIKILLEFTDVFWNELRNDKHIGPALKKMGFVYSPEKIPTWWTQFPASTPLMTGWLAGPRSFSIASMPEKEILDMAIESLSAIFQREKVVIERNISAWQIANWAADLFAQGAYAYDTLYSREAVKILMEPVENTLFFAGEAVYHGSYMGTVEAALTSALEAVVRLKK